MSARSTFVSPPVTKQLETSNTEKLVQLEEDSVVYSDMLQLT